MKGDRSILFSMFSFLAESSISIDFYAFYAESQGSVSKDLCMAEFILLGGNPPHNAMEEREEEEPTRIRRKQIWPKNRIMYSFQDDE